MTVAYSDSLPTLYVVHRRPNPVLCGPNSTEPYLFHHWETTYRVGWLSEYATVMHLKKDVCFLPAVQSFITELALASVMHTSFLPSISIRSPFRSFPFFSDLRSLSRSRASFPFCICITFATGSAKKEPWTGLNPVTSLLSQCKQELQVLQETDFPRN